jgi:hypothetical protein
MAIPMRTGAATLKRNRRRCSLNWSDCAAASPVKPKRVLSEEGMGLYVLAKHEETDEAALHSTVDAMVGELPEGWRVHRNGNNAALMPPWLGKEHAVGALLPRLRERHPDAPVIGIGDSLTDAPYMALCDYAMMPRGSQLAAGTLDRLLPA